MANTELSAQETKVIYDRICSQNIKPYKAVCERKYSEFYYQLDGVKYCLVYDRAGDWFSDIIYRVEE